MTAIPIDAAPPAAPAMSPQTQRLLTAPIIPTLLIMAWPNVLVMLAQTSTGLIETWWVSRLGVDALAAMALVFPPVMLMQMISGGAMGGGISAAIARALGGGRKADADALVLHALLINVGLGVAFSAIMLIWGRPIYVALGGKGQELELALVYSNIVFSGNALLWLMNALASVIRGGGNMLTPALVTVAGVVLLVPLSPLLIFGLGPIPGFGIAGAGMALVAFYFGGAAVLGWYVLTGRSLARFILARLRWPMFADILKVGAVGSISSLQTNVTIATATAMVAASAGVNAVAGFGTAARLEYLLVPVVFGLGSPLVALVGTNIGAGNRDRAMRIAMTGAALAFAFTEAIGVVAAIWPGAWLGLFSVQPAMIEAGTAYLHWAGPAFGFFGMGLALYFASQGAGKLLWPLLGGTLRVALALGAGWLALRLTGQIGWLFAAMALGLVVYGVTLLTAVRAGVWFSDRRS